MNEKILLADDAPFMRLLQKDALKKYGYEVCGEASDGSDAVEKYDELQPDIMVLGLIFPKVDGIEVLRQIKKEYPESKIIVCSSLSRESAVTDSLKYGAGNFIVKPFNAEFFVSAVRSAAENKKLAAWLNQDTLDQWCLKQKNYPPNENLTQEQVSKIVESYHRLYQSV